MSKKIGLLRIRFENQYKMNCILTKKSLLFVCLMLLTLLPATAQTRLIEGTVVDSLTQEPLGYVSVYLRGTTHGAMTSEDGKFSLTASPSQTLVASCIGYHEKRFAVSRLKQGAITIKLVPSDYQLAEVVVKPKKEKYTKKGNPAVEFVEKVIKSRKEADPRTRDFYSFQRYEKTIYAFNDVDSVRQQRWLYRKFNFLKDYIDTSEITHKPILNFSIKEKLENNYYRRDPQTTKKVIEAYKHDGLDEIIPEEGLDEVTSEAFKEINIYDNDITLFFNKFVSPISSMGPNFYKYYLLDTLVIDGQKYQDLGFVPRVSETFGFTGHLYVALDSTYFIKKAVLNTPMDINLNFVKALSITQEYERTPDSLRLLMKDDMAMEFTWSKNQNGGVYARRTNTYRKHSFEEPPASVFNQKGETVTLAEARYHDKDYWEANRHEKIPEKESAVTHMLANLRAVPVFYYTEKLVSTVVDGYAAVPLDSPYVNIGPINTMISGNSFEGARFRLGGMTMPRLSPNWFGSGYVAYGTRDKKIKYNAMLTYSFINKRVHMNEFPVHSISASYYYDINQLGQQYLYTNMDNIVLSLKRMEDDRTIYLRKAELKYQREHEFGLSYGATLRNKKEYATSCVPFRMVTGFDEATQQYDYNSVKDYTQTEAEFKIRYAPGEKFYQMKNRRIPITRDAPVFQLSHITARKGWLGSDYNFNRTEASFSKCFWFSAYGYLDTYLNAGKVWDAVPFPMLILPNANLSYIIEPLSWSLMNPVEFINDEYFSWDVTYFLNGWLFNRIPGLKRLKWREVTSFRGMIGNLSDKNNPEINTSGRLYEFPSGSGPMGKKPYMECSVGVENIFKLLRVDYVWRLSYLDQPYKIDKRGVRVSMHVTF